MSEDAALPPPPPIPADSRRSAPRRLVIAALEANWSRFEAKGVSDLGILIDWCGLYQAPRDNKQQRVFGAALKAINQARSRPCPGARHMHTKGHTGCSMATRCMARLGTI